RSGMMLATGSSRRAAAEPSASRMLAGLFLALALLFLSGLQALSQTPDLAAARAKLDGLRNELKQIETVLAQTDPTDAELQRQRSRLQPVIEQLRVAVEEQGPRLEQAKLRLEQLGPKPEANAPAETAEVVREREARAKAFADADEAIKIARAALLQGEQM